MSVVSLSWETAHLHGDAWISHHRLRHRLFIERNAWEVPAYKGFEYDQFDTPAAQYLLWLDDAGQTRGATRLIPTTQPYMIQQLWPELLHGDPPTSLAVWEATRFGFDDTLDAGTRRRAVQELLCAMHEFGIANRITRFLAVMSPPLLRRVPINAGCAVTQLGPIRRLGGQPVVAAGLAITLNVLAELRRRASITGPVLCSDLSIAA